MQDEVSFRFQERFGRAPECIVRSPGRVNLIGDHTDYNNGFALPIAIDQATWIAAGRRSDRDVHLSSTGFGDVSVSLHTREKTGSWVDYVVGVLLELPRRPPGFEALIHSDIPIGAGLSSSAALEMGMARLAAELTATTWDPLQAARLGQRAENNFVGVPSGIMDQLTVTHGRPGHALLIDFVDLSTKAVPLSPSASIVILDTGTRRRLADSAYADRRAACRRAAESLCVSTLRDLDLETLDDSTLEPALATRARHVVTENARTLSAAVSMEKGDLASFGGLMNESHQSLRDDFAVSSLALDAIADVARRHPGCFGARMTGGGFAGCAVALVDAAGSDRFIADVKKQYEAATGHESELFRTSAAAGVAVVYPPARRR